jgi:DUF4097 and DUF4098 domain-containing protein YvlB
MKIFRTMLTAALTVMMLICLSGCSVKLNYNYDNADKYIPGDREITEKIENIDIDYMAGNVTVKGDKTTAVTVMETSKTEIDDKLKVHTWVDGSTLHVKYCAAGKGLSIKDLKKTLEITVPADVKLSDLSIDASAGDVDVTAESIGKLAIDISSGNMKLSADKVPEKSEIDAAAGNVEIYMPEKTDMTLKADISAGDFNSEIPFTKKGDAYIFGNGKSRMDIDASAGNINIKKK